MNEGSKTIDELREGLPPIEVAPDRGLWIVYQAGDVVYPTALTVAERPDDCDIVLFIAEGKCPALPTYPDVGKRQHLLLGLRAVPWAHIKSGHSRIHAPSVDQFAARAKWLEW